MEKGIGRRILARFIFLTYLILCYVTMSSLFATVPRFALRVAPLFILVMAFSAQILKEAQR